MEVARISSRAPTAAVVIAAARPISFTPSCRIARRGVDSCRGRCCLLAEVCCGSGVPALLQCREFVKLGSCSRRSANADSWNWPNRVCRSTGRIKSPCRVLSRGTCSLRFSKVTLANAAAARTVARKIRTMWMLRTTKQATARLQSHLPLLGEWRCVGHSCHDSWSGVVDTDKSFLESAGASEVGDAFVPQSAAGEWWRRWLSLALLSVGAAVVFEATLQTPYSFAASWTDPPIEERVADLPRVPTEFSPLPDISPLPYEKFVLPNGLRVFLLEDHELGLIGGELLVNGGSKLEPADKVGLAKLSSNVQRSGGSIAHPGEELDAELDTMAARIETSSSLSEMSVGFRCLTEDLPVVLSLFSEVVQEPLMPENKLELSRSQYTGIIARRPDDAGGIVNREFNKLLYGKESVYARIPELPTLRAVNRDDLLSFHKKTFRPDKGVLGIWGDFNASAVKKLVEQTFANWVPAPEERTLTSTEPAQLSASETGCSANPPSVYLINRPGLTQGYVRMGEFGTTLADPDVFALDVLNGILNGFGGLLFDEVRSREGLAYSVSGGWSPAVEHRGAFIAGGETRVQAIPQFVRALKRVLENVRAEPPNEDLLARAKEKALNSFVFNFANSGAQLGRILSYELFGIDRDFLLRYKEGVESTTALDVLKVAQRHLHPNSQPILIVTDTLKLNSLLPAFSQPVVSLDIDYLSGRDGVKPE